MRILKITLIFLIRVIFLWVYIACKIIRTFFCDNILINIVLNVIIYIILIFLWSKNRKNVRRIV